jgi:hypothetical protein
MRAIEIGTEVIHAHHTNTYLYGGPGDNGPGWCSIRLTLGQPGISTMTCDPDQVAPAGAVQLNPADPRYRIEKLPRKRHAWDPGPWLAHVDGLTDPDSPPAFETKRDAVAYATKRLAIADYHAAEQQERTAP